jgi:hypothetical protein
MIRVIVSVAVLAALLSGSVAWAKAAPPTWSIRHVRGEVVYLRKGGKGTKKLVRISGEMRLKIGDRVRTGAESSVTLVGSGYQMDLAPQAEVIVSAAKRLQLNYGIVRFRGKSQQSSLSLPTAQLSFADVDAWVAVMRNEPEFQKRQQGVLEVPPQPVELARLQRSGAFFTQIACFDGAIRLSGYGKQAKPLMLQAGEVLRMTGMMGQDPTVLPQRVNRDEIRATREALGFLDGGFHH